MDTDNSMVRTRGREGKGLGGGGQVGEIGGNL